MSALPSVCLAASWKDRQMPEQKRRKTSAAQHILRGKFTSNFHKGKQARSLSGSFKCIKHVFFWLFFLRKTKILLNLWDTPRGIATEPPPLSACHYLSTSHTLSDPNQFNWISCAISESFLFGETFPRWLVYWLSFQGAKYERDIWCRTDCGELKYVEERNWEKEWKLFHIELGWAKSFFTYDLDHRNLRL